MANRFVYTFRRLSFLLHRPPSSLPRVVLQHSPVTPFYSLYPWKISLGFSPMSYSSVSVVLTEGTPKFVVQEAEIPKKEKWRTKKRLKMQRMREKRKRKLASKTDPRRLTIKGKKQRFPNAEARIIYKIEKALEKSKYEQSLESVRRFIAISEKELELYYRHVALYGNPSCRDSLPRYALQNNCNGRESLQCSNARTVKVNG